MQTKKDISKVLEEAKKNYHIERADTAKIEDVTNFFKIAYTDQFNAADYQDEKDILRRWKWANVENPHIKDEEFPAWFCKDNKKNEIIGHLGVIPVSIKIKNKFFYAVWGRDMIVPLKWRKSGIASFLFDMVTEENKDKAALFLLAGLNDYAVTIYKKVGFMHLGYIPLYIRIVKSDALLQQYVRNRILLNLLSFIGALALRIFYMPSWIRMRTANKSICVKEISFFDDSFDMLWGKISPSFSIIIRRDSKSLNWRFVNQPYWDYKIFKAENKKDGELMGYVVLREGESNGARIGVVSDFFSQPDDIATTVFLVNFIIKYFEKKENIDLIRCDILNKKIEHILKGLGFINVRSKSHFMILGINKELDREFIVKRDNWFINYADCDLDLSGRKD